MNVLEIIFIKFRKDVKTDFFFVRCRRTYVLKNIGGLPFNEKRSIKTYSCIDWEP